jgi:hypothetical protein
VIDYFRRYAAALDAMGYRPIPILPGTKKPMVNDWPHFELRPGDADRYALASVGVLCGHGLVIADADVYSTSLAAWTKTMLLAHLGMAPCRLGRLPKFALPYRLDAARATGKTASRGWRDPADTTRKVNRLEFLGRGNYLVTHGIHPETQSEYRWMDENLARLPQAKLSEIASEDITRVTQKFDAQCVILGYEEVTSHKARAEAHCPSKQGQRAVDAERILAAVATIPNEDLPYEDWIEVGMALKGALGDTAEGLEAWLDFCQQYPGNDVDSSIAKWDSFHPKAIGAGTILHLAREAQRRKGLDLFAPIDAPTPSHGVPVPEKVAEQGYREPTYAAPAGLLAQAIGRIGWLVPGVMHLGHVYTLTAKPSHGKTSITALLAACVQGGTPFCGIPTRRGQVICCCADDPYGMLDRLQLLAMEGLPDAANVLVSMNAFDATAVDVAEQFTRIAEDKGEISLITLDTIIYYTPQAITDENDNLGLARFLAALRELTKLPGHPTIIAQCHPPKGAANDPEALIPRGGSAVLAASDGNLTIWREEDIVTLHHSAKMRGEFDELVFRLERGVQIGELVDDDGRPVKTVRIKELGERELQIVVAQEQAADVRVLRWMQARERGEWVGAGAIELALRMHKRQVQRALAGLIEGKLVRRRGNARATVYQAVVHG